MATLRLVPVLARPDFGAAGAVAPGSSSSVAGSAAGAWSVVGAGLGSEGSAPSSTFHQPFVTWIASLMKPSS